MVFIPSPLSYTNNSYTWYHILIKILGSPFLAFWTRLDDSVLLIAASFGTVFYKAYTKELPWIVVLPFALNLLFNFLFTPLQFGFKNNLLAALDILLVFITLVWALLLTYPKLP
jgi:tryptophan-rich sensory protein